MEKEIYVHKNPHGKSRLSTKGRIHPDGVKYIRADVVEEQLKQVENLGLFSVSGSALLTDLLKAQQEIISSPLRFNGVAIEDIKRIFADYGIKYEPPF